MKSARNIVSYLVLACAVLLFAAGTSQMESAKRVLDKIGIALDSVSANAQKYVRDRLAAGETKVADLTVSYERKDYQAIVIGAPRVMAQVQAMSGAVAAAKKDEITQAFGTEWSGRSRSVPALVRAVKAVEDELTKTERLPKDVEFATAKLGVAHGPADSEKAKATYKLSRVEDVATADRTTKAMAQGRAATSLKMRLPGAGS